MQVNHSQNLSVPPVQVWTLVKSDGEVIAAHCSCMAGIGEACSHVAALLFYLECVARARKDRSCTDGANLWLPPHLSPEEIFWEQPERHLLLCYLILPLERFSAAM